MYVICTFRVRFDVVRFVFVISQCVEQLLWISMNITIDGVVVLHSVVVYFNGMLFYYVSFTRHFLNTLPRTRKPMDNESGGRARCGTNKINTA